MRMTTSKIIGCPPSALWPWIDELERCKQWMRGLEDAQPVSAGPKGVGHRSTLFIREGGKLQEYAQTILEYEPERRFKMRMEGGCLRGSVVVVDYVLTDLHDGRTRLDYECTAEMKGFLRFVGPLFAILGRMQVRMFFKKLEQLAEGRGAAPAAS